MTTSPYYELTPEEKELFSSMYPGKSETLLKMFFESTGTHMLDSGGDNNRRWQQHRAEGIKKFLERPEFVIETEHFEKEPAGIYTLHQLRYTLNTFKLLQNQLSEDDICKDFNAMPDEGECCDAHYALTEEKFEKLLGLLMLNTQQFLESSLVNTYNFDNCIDSTLLYRNLGEGYVLLNVHGGADVRGGYTYPKLFKCDNELFLDPFVEIHWKNSMILVGEGSRGSIVPETDYDTQLFAVNSLTCYITI